MCHKTHITHSLLQKIKVKKINYHLLQFLFGALRVKKPMRSFPDCVRKPIPISPALKEMAHQQWCNSLKSIEGVSWPIFEVKHHGIRLPFQLRTCQVGQRWADTAPTSRIHWEFVYARHTVFAMKNFPKLICKHMMTCNPEINMVRNTINGNPIDTTSSTTTSLLLFINIQNWCIKCN